MPTPTLTEKQREVLAAPKEAERLRRLDGRENHQMGSGY
jgi:hypothetical protein